MFQLKNNFIANQTFEQHVEIAQDAPRSSACGRNTCFTSKCQQMPHTAPSHAASFCLICIISWYNGWSAWLRLEQKICAHDDARENIVEIMRNATGKLANKCHFLILK